jgi:hypothetical protein
MTMAAIWQVSMVQGNMQERGQENGCMHP